MKSIYKLMPGYRGVTIWKGEDSGKIVSIETCKPFTAFSRKSRYDIIAKRIEYRGMEAPKYIPLKGKVAAKSPTP